MSATPEHDRPADHTLRRYICHHGKPTDDHTHHFMVDAYTSDQADAIARTRCLAMGWTFYTTCPLRE
jgi:hypothetical protein